MSLTVWVKKLKCENGDSLHALEKDLKEVEHRLRKSRLKLEREEQRIQPLRDDVASCSSRIANLTIRIRIWHDARVRAVKDMIEIVESEQQPKKP